ncbi:hypothetical protein EDB83DRAFT_2555496 [Lactarius deliciosus]|nr:hypothetical protein EDB83DRAFT_2555496 [Lactarius deliciosus]
MPPSQQHYSKGMTVQEKENPLEWHLPRKLGQGGGRLEGGWARKGPAPVRACQMSVGVESGGEGRGQYTLAAGTQLGLPALQLPRIPKGKRAHPAKSKLSESPEGSSKVSTKEEMDPGRCSSGNSIDEKDREGRLVSREEGHEAVGNEIREGAVANSQQTTRGEAEREGMPGITPQGQLRTNKDDIPRQGTNSAQLADSLGVAVQWVV